MAIAQVQIRDIVMVKAKTSWLGIVRFISPQGIVVESIGQTFGNKKQVPHIPPKCLEVLGHLTNLYEEQELPEKLCQIIISLWTKNVRFEKQYAIIAEQIKQVS